MFGYLMELEYDGLLMVKNIYRFLGKVYKIKKLKD